MGASVGPYWPGIEEELTEEQLESRPGFFNSCKGWGNWMAYRLMEPRTLEAIRNLKADAILSSTTNGEEDEDVDWVTPQELREAAQRLGEAISAGLPDTKIILESYERSSRSYVHADSWITSVEEDFLSDLESIEVISRWAEEMGAVKMTLEVNW
jgi:hypothetical protein